MANSLLYFFQPFMHLFLLQRKDLMILLEVRIMLLLKFCTDLIVWKQIYGALE